MEPRPVSLRIHLIAHSLGQVINGVFIRHIIWIGTARADVDGVCLCRMFNHAIAGKQLAKDVSTDHDPLFRFHRWLANLRVLEIDELKAVLNDPMSHPFIERFIGTLRREYLHRIVF